MHTLEASLTRSAVVRCLAPVDGTYTDRTSLIAEYVGRAIAATRHDETIEATATRVLAKHGVTIATADAERIGELIMLDTCLDSEELMAGRAALAVLTAAFGDTMQVTGWISGRRLVVDKDVFVLTLELCPSCELNPLAHGHGGGVRCLNVPDCGYSDCF